MVRPGRPLRRTGPSLGPLLGFALVLIVLAAGGWFVWQSRQARATVEAAPQTIGPTSPAETPTPTLTPSATLPVVSSGSVPETQATVAPGTPAEITPVAAAADPALATGTAPAAPGAGAGQAATATPATRATDIASEAAGGAATAAPRATSGIAAAAATTSGAASASAGVPDLAALIQRMLERVNADRDANGLKPVAWDETAGLAGQRHSEEMAQFGYMSHWNMDGYGPEVRYSRAGGLDFSQENVYRLVHQWQDGRGAPIDDWEQVIDDAEAALMNSPGHRANILTPEHTHLGVGLAFNPVTGSVAIAQEFVNRYVTIEPLPRRARPGDRIVLRGVLREGSLHPLVNLANEPFPLPMTLEQLNKTGTYTPAAKHLAVPPVRVDASGRFVAEFTLDKAAPPGLYHVLVWVESPAAAGRVLAVDAVVEVSE